MSEEVKPVPLEEDVSKVLKGLERIAEKLDMPLWQLLPLMTHREIVILNSELRAIHQHLHWLCDRLIKRGDSQGHKE